VSNRYSFSEIELQSIATKFTTRTIEMKKERQLWAFQYPDLLVQVFFPHLNLKAVRNGRVGYNAGSFLCHQKKACKWAFHIMQKNYLKRNLEVKQE